MAVYKGTASKCFESSIKFFSNQINIDLKEVVRSFTSTSGCWRLKEPLPATTFSSKRAGEDDAEIPRPGPEKPELVDKYLGLATASRKEEVKSEIQQAIRDFQRFDGDTGSSEVQVALLTTKIAALADHLKIHAKDHSSRRGLRAMLNQRRKLLQYLRRTKFDNYAKLIARIGLKDSFGPQDRFSQRYKIK